MLLAISSPAKAGGISRRLINTWYSSAGYGVFHCGKTGSEGYGVVSLDMGYSTAGYGVFHMGYAVNWV